MQYRMMPTNPADLETLKIAGVCTTLSTEHLARIGECVQDKIGPIQRIECIEYTGPLAQTNWQEQLHKNSIETVVLTDAVDREIGGNVLVITDLDLKDSTNNEPYPFMFGGKDTRNLVVAASTARLNPESDLFRKRLKVVSLHEMGHNFGLNHHIGGRVQDGYCPMAKINRGVPAEHKYKVTNGRVPAERAYRRAVIDLRSYDFCASCKDAIQTFMNEVRTRYQGSQPVPHSLE